MILAGTNPGEARGAKTLARWTLMVAALFAVTVGLYAVRASLDKAHVALVYLLVVLAASAAGGRKLGLAIAGLAFLCFDFFFLVPYETLTIENPLDWLVLLTFLITSVVAAQLLYRANTTAEEATQRAIEVDRLAALGAETLNAADADEALRAIAGVIRRSVNADECDIYLHAIDGRVVRVAHATSDPQATNDSDRLVEARRDSDADGATRPGSLVEWILDHGASAVELTDGTVRVAHELSSPTEASAWQRREPLHETIAAVGAVTRVEVTKARGLWHRTLHGDDGRDDPRTHPQVRAVAVPLRVLDRTVGVLRLAAREELTLTPEQARLLVALAYYAALGAERARLVATAERAEAERRLESLRGALLTALSHDLRTPLTTIKGVASEIRRGAGADRAAVIEGEADRLNALVGDLLDLSRIHAGAVKPAVALNTVDDLIGAALRASSGILDRRRVEVDAPKDTLLVGSFDFTQTLRILVNLLDNAAKYSPAGAPIEIRARQDGDRLVIQVMDRGPGVADEERERIFDPFYRPPSVPPDVRGHGLGLSIARGLAVAQGGSLGVAPRAGGGAVFTLGLPGAMADLPAPDPTPGD